MYMNLVACASDRTARSPPSSKSCEFNALAWASAGITPKWEGGDHYTISLKFWQHDIKIAIIRVTLIYFGFCTKAFKLNLSTPSLLRPLVLEKTFLIFVIDGKAIKSFCAAIVLHMHWNYLRGRQGEKIEGLLHLFILAFASFIILIYANKLRYCLGHWKRR